MKYYIIIFILFISKFFISQEEKINFLNFGIINITSELLLDNANWEVNLEFNDTIFYFNKKSTSNQQNLFFNINEKISSTTILNDIPFVTIKKDGKLLYKKKTQFNFNNNSKYVLLANEVSNAGIKGEIIDSYEIQFERGKYYIVRSSIRKLYNYWYLINGDKIINIHSEKKYKQPSYMGKIILSDLDDNKFPEISFFYMINDKIKMIHFNSDKKIVVYKDSKKTNFPFTLMENEDLVHNGFFYYNLKKISE